MNPRHLGFRSKNSSSPSGSVQDFILSGAQRHPRLDHGPDAKDAYPHHLNKDYRQTTCHPFSLTGTTRGTRTKPLRSYARQRKHIDPPLQEAIHSTDHRGDQDRHPPGQEAHGQEGWRLPHPPQLLQLPPRQDQGRQAVHPESRGDDPRRRHHGGPQLPSRLPRGVGGDLRILGRQTTRLGRRVPVHRPGTEIFKQRPSAQRYGLPAKGCGTHPNPFRTRKLNHAPSAAVVMS